MDLSLLSFAALPIDEQLHRYGPRALEVLVEFLGRCRRGDSRVIELRAPEEAIRALGLREWIERGGMDPEELGAFLRAYLERTTKLHHPGYLGHQVAAAQVGSMVADLVNGATNNGMAIYEMGPPGVAIELCLIEWMLGKVGWSAGGGALTHGGSLANLTALLAARAAAAPAAWEEGTPPDLAVLAPEAAHYSVARAASILGLGARSVYPLATDELQVLRPETLEATHRRARSDGRRVMAVVASACATATGLYDPLHEVGQYCREHGLWFHVDGAHGASALLSDLHRHRMRGVELADSLIWDAHKMLHTSALCAAVLVRDAGRLPRAFRQKAEYLVDQSQGIGPDPLHQVIECTKGPLGLKLFLNLAILGERGLAGLVDHLYQRTHDFYEQIRARPGFECPYPPQSNILCFRRAGDDALQVRLRKALMDEGRYYLSSATIHGRRYLRFTVMNPATSTADVAGVLDAVERLAAAPAADHPG